MSKVFYQFSVSTKTMASHPFFHLYTKSFLSHTDTVAVFRGGFYRMCRCELQRRGVCCYRQGRACQSELITAHWPPSL